MNNMNLSKFTKGFLLSGLLLSFTPSSIAQSADGTVADGSLVILLFTAVMVLVVFLAAILGDKIIRLANSKSDKNVGLIPSLREVIPAGQSYLKGDASKRVINLKQGFDIKLNGKAKKVVKNYSSDTYAVKPTDFVGLQPIPKMLVKEGAQVKAGDKLFYDKGFEGVFFTAPVSGELVEIKRGAKRSIAEIVIKSDGKFESVSFSKANPKSLSREEVLSQLTESGAFTFFTERPFGVVPNLANLPKSIHVSAFDTAPLAVDYNFLLSQIDAKDLQAGFDALSKLTNQVHLNINADKADNVVLENLVSVQKNYFRGAHPAGNVGVQIHHVDAIQKGEFVWTIKLEDVVTIGKLFTKGIFEPIKYVAVAGGELQNNYYVKTILGANVNNLVANNLKNDNVRFIAGNVLTGKAIQKDGYLGHFDNQLTVIEEGNEYEMFGWLLPQYAKPSISPTYPWSMMDFMKFDVNTNTHGEKRAFVVTGQYEEVLPMDVYPQYLMKAIIKNDFEEIEGLGIYEVIEEDVALCEFVCTSKQPLQGILREGLDFIRSQS